MEESASNFTAERLRGGENNNKMDIISGRLNTDIDPECTTEAESDGEICSKSRSSSFLQRTLRTVLRIRRNPSASSYDLDSGLSMPSSKDDCFSENEEKCDGIDSGIASEAGDCPTSSRLSSCTNYTGSSFGDRVPGIYGIPNLGNTCYMNSVLQCLAHLDVVVEYFALGKYRADMKQKRNICKSRKLEHFSKAKLTEHLAGLLKSLWTVGCSKDICQEFKESVLKYGEQYRGELQQDAQEFLLWLLNHLHEELCKTSSWSLYSKPSLIKKKKHCTEEEQAARTLATHAHHNKSFIKNIFQAQYKSSIHCPNCNTCSSTFDPYLSISLSIPQKDTKPMYITMLYSSTDKVPTKMAVSIPYSGNIRDLRQILSKSIGVSQERLILILAYDDGDHCSLHDESMVDAIPELDDCLFGIEIPAQDAVKSLSGAATKAVTLTRGSSDLTQTNETKTVDTKTVGMTATVDGLAANFNQRLQLSITREENNTTIIVVTNVELKAKRTRRFGFPIVLRVSRDISFKDLQILIRREMPSQVRTAINKEARNWKLVLGIRVIGGVLHNEYLRETDTHPLRQPTVERGLMTNLTAGPPHVSLVAEWEPESPDWCLAAFGLGCAQEDPSVKQLEEEFREGQNFSLTDCLDLHTKDEELQYEDCWKCPNCKTDMNRTTKKLSLWSLPDVLVFHLKRFQQANQWKGKISADVQCPLHGLDMSPHLAARSKVYPQVDKKNFISKSYSYPGSIENEDCVYDLFAVCNHIGPYITSGHYTANCRNSANGSWYCFDDTSVYEITEEQVCTRSAYLVFYQKRSAVTRSVSSCSLSSICSHWSQVLSRTASMDTETER